MEEHILHQIRAVTLLLLSKFQQGVDYVKLFKTIYFAQKEFLLHFGMEICPDTFVARRNGPVPETTYKVIKLKERGAAPPDELKEFYDSIKVERKKVYLNAQDQEYLQYLSPVAQVYLDKWYETCKNKTSKELSEESHDEAYKAAIASKSKAMTPLEIAKHSGADPAILEHLENVECLMRAFG